MDRIQCGRGRYPAAHLPAREDQASSRSHSSVLLEFGSRDDFIGRGDGRLATAGGKDEGLEVSD